MTNTASDKHYVLLVDGTHVAGPFSVEEGRDYAEAVLDRGGKSRWYTVEGDYPDLSPVGMLPIYLFLRNGRVRVIAMDCNAESPFQALERVYRSKDGDDFMTWDIDCIRFHR